LQQALWNLLKNAVKFTPEGGRIDVSTRNDAHGHVQVIMTDTGIGISPQMIGRLFTPFEQETAGRYGGLGLGLAITKALLEAQNGEIEARSEGPFRGATFIITLPCVDAPVAPAPKAKAASGNGDSAKDQHENCYRVLLVEDHADTARVLARLLRGNGHKVSAAHTVAEALAAARSQPFDVLVSDLGLPDGTGIDLIREIRRQYGSMPAVALTGFGMDDDVTRTREAGFDSHLTKPVNFARLEQAIQRACHDAGEDGIECPE
jgi:CheY-like chemotaxis protein